MTNHKTCEWCYAPKIYSLATDWYEATCECQKAFNNSEAEREEREYAYWRHVDAQIDEVRGK